MPTFDGHKYINFETFRKNGGGVKTPLWFAEDGGALYARSFEGTGKAKRLRRDSRARVVPCDVRGNALGEWVVAEAWILDDTSEAKRADRLLNEKYGILKRLIEPVAGLRHGKVVSICIRPEVVPDGASGEG